MPQPPEGQVEQTTQAAPVLEPQQPTSVTPAETPPPPIETAPVEPPAQKADETKDGQTVELRTSDFKRIKEKASEKGRRSERLVLDERAKELGYASVEELFEAIATKSSEPEPTIEKEEEEESMAPTKKKKQTTKRSVVGQNRYKRKFERAEKARKENMRKWRAAEKRRRDAQRQLAAKEAEMELREVAIQAGVKDVDYAIRLLTRKLHGKTEEELASFDESGFFTDLRDERPYLFGEQVIPANTGSTSANSGDEPPAPGPDQTQQVEAESTQFDARKASPEEVAQRYKELGLRQPLV